MINKLTAVEAKAERSWLIELLQDAVESGASVGFLPPLSSAEADDYWNQVERDLNAGACVLLVAREGKRVEGTVQVGLALKANGTHRAEVQRLLVHREARRQGIGRALMLEVEAEVVRLGRTLLVLDTRKGDPSEALYHSIGYLEAGAIPSYARSADGSLHTTVFFYKELNVSEASPLD